MKINYKKLTWTIVAIAIIVRILISLMVVPSGDSVMHSNAAIFIHENYKIPIYENLGRLDVFWSPPLFHLTGAFIMLFLPLCVLPALFGGMCLIVFYFLCKNFLDDEKTFYAVLFLSFIPISIYYSTIFFVDIALMFICLLIVYFALKQNFVMTSICCGIGMLIKYNVVFIFPLALWLLFRNYNFKKKDTLLISIFAFGIIALAVSSIWYLRNFDLFGNPFYHFFNPILSGMGFNVFDAPFLAEHSSHSLVEIFDWQWYFSWYLDLFGVPLGRIANLLLIPFKPFSLILWFFATIIFFFPLLMECIVKKSKFINTFLLLWIIPFLLQMFLFVKDLGSELVFFRYFLPAIPVLAIFWGKGMFHIIKNFGVWGRVYFVIVLIICGGFVMGEFYKTKTASDRINKFNADFDWVKENTPMNSFVYPSGFAYYVSREGIPLNMSLVENLTFYVEIPSLFDKKSVLNNETLSHFVLVYENNVTKTRVFKLVNSTNVDLYTTI